MPTAAGEAAAAGPGRLELADVLRLYGDAYRRGHNPPSSHCKIMRDIVSCRTAALGGHMERCDACGLERPAYNSCRNRHCPKCQALAKARWLEARRADLLPVDYFHVVFTIPHELNAVALYNKQALYDILFHAASQTLQEFGADPRHGLAGRLGFTGVLHTWDQQLRYHVHLHCLVAGGALSADGQRWTSARAGFLFPVRALSKVFRGKFLDSLGCAAAAGRLRLPDALCPPPAWAAFLTALRKKDWVVYAKRPFAGPQGVLDYLGRYTHRVAISNERIVRVGDGKVTFTWRDRAHGDTRKLMALDAVEFIRRFLLHALPQGYVRVRHFGLLSPATKGRDLARCRELSGQTPHPMPPAPETTRELMLRLTGVDLNLCPRCGQGTMQYVCRLLAARTGSTSRNPQRPRPPDTS
jgi:hypothetical protein